MSSVPGTSRAGSALIGSAGATANDIASASHAPVGRSRAGARGPLIKVEYIHRQRFSTRAEARLRIATWITDFYNPRRRHNAAAGLPPTEFERTVSEAQAEHHQKDQAA